jgi:hypothetical protein
MQRDHVAVHAGNTCPFVLFSYDTKFVRERVIRSTSSNINDNNTGQFKKKVTLSHVYNEVISEPTITRYTTTVKKTLQVCM